LLFTCYGIGIILTRLASARWLDSAPLSHVLTIATLIKAGGLALAAFGQNSIMLAASAVIIAVGSGLFHPALIAHHATLLPGEPGRATAGFYLAFDLGIGAGGWLLGIILQQFGLTGLYLTAAFVVLAALPLSLGEQGTGNREEG
jgi:predicted MFS family arabinose efflux permease